MHCGGIWARGASWGCIGGSVGHPWGIWGILELCGTVWGCVGVPGAVGGVLGLYRGYISTSWGHMGHPGAVRNRTEHPGAERGAHGASWGWVELYGVPFFGWETGRFGVCSLKHTPPHPAQPSLGRPPEHHHRSRLGISKPNCKDFKEPPALRWEDLGGLPWEFSIFYLFSSFLSSPFSPTDHVQRAAHHQAGLRGRVQHDHGLQRQPLLLRVPRVRAAGYGAASGPFATVPAVGDGGKTFVASVSPSGRCLQQNEWGGGCK